MVRFPVLHKLNNIIINISIILHHTHVHHSLYPCNTLHGLHTTLHNWSACTCIIYKLRALASIGQRGFRLTPSPASSIFIKQLKTIIIIIQSELLQCIKVLARTNSAIILKYHAPHAESITELKFSKALSSCLYPQVSSGNPLPYKVKMAGCLLQNQEVID